MDLYLTSAEPGLTLQEMIDCDIKSGVDFDTSYSGDSLLTSFDLSGITGLEAELDLKSLEPLFDPLDRLEEEEAMETGGGSRPIGEDTPPVASWMNFSAMTNFNLDVETSLMVNPSMVLPSPHHPLTKTHEAPSQISPAIKRENLNPNSPSSCEVFHATSTHVVMRSVTTTTTTGATLSSSPDTLPSLVSSSGTPSTSIVTNSTTHHRHIATTTAPTPIGSLTPSHKTINSASSSSPPATTTTIPIYQSSRPNGSSFVPVPNRSKTHQKFRRDRTPEEKSYPKPAYSYACLIALALKNSITGSLPVSEIYSFMCEHFPYFRTAPNGWKNSVRHNLSLNKCFEKIEKPVVSGSNQRKGCLWALNPLKAHKMDEEVQKWSKKDLQGIRDAMTCPDVLESLEKGEMKFEATSGASSCSEDEEDEEGVVDTLTYNDFQHQTSLPPVKITNTHISGISQAVNNPSRATQNGIRSSPKPLKLQESNMSPTVHSHSTPQQIVRRTVSISPEPEYILPDSTMSEINIQSNGALFDDFGNEITLDGDLSVLNPRVSTTPSTGTNLILRKVNASPIRNSSIRSNFVYASPNSTNLLPHQNGINRLVLTNAKLTS